MFLKKGQLPILISILILLAVFLPMSLQKKNYEFVMYIGVIIIFFLLILATNKKHNLSNGVLWGLVVWAILHMCGGFVYLNGTRLYEIQLLNIITRPEYYILRYDQFVHMFGFGLTTFIAYEILKPYLNKKVNWVVVSALLMLIAIGVGAVNEIIEFITVVIVPETGVGGFYNTSLDLVANGVGAFIAIFIVNFLRKKVDY